MVGEELRTTGAGYFTFIKLPTGHNRFNLAWFTEVVWGIPKDETNTAAMGPVVQIGDDKLSLTLNTFIERSFGRNSVDETDLIYAARLKKEVREGFSIGLEGYGVVPHIGHSSGTSSSEFRLGPVVYFERNLGGSRGHGAGKMSIKDSGGGHGGDSPKLSMEAGILLGLTEATPDLTGKVKLGLEF